MVRFYKGVAGRRPGKPKGICIHNDGGSANANAAFYRRWLPDHPAENGFAHVYVGNDGVYYAEDLDNMAWHTANAVGNMWYIGIEVCQSLGSKDQFLRNEQEAFKVAAEICRQYGLDPNYAIFPLHKEFSATDCPHRSTELHGPSIQAVRNYFTQEVRKYRYPEAPKPSNHGRKWHSDKKGWWVRDEKGFAIKGWVIMDGYYYFMDPKTEYMITGWRKISGVWYYFDKSGKMIADGWKWIGDAWFYFNKNGNMKTGWIKDTGKWYYADKNGRMQSGKTIRIDGKDYKFNNSGVCLNP